MVVICLETFRICWKIYSTYQSSHRMASERKAVTVFLQKMLNTKYKEQQQGYQYRIYSKSNVWG